LIVIGRQTAQAKRVAGMHTFIIDMQQPYYLQIRSEVVPEEFLCVIPQQRLFTAGEYRAKTDAKWLTYIVGTLIGNIDAEYLDNLQDIVFEPADTGVIRRLIERDPLDLQVQGIPRDDTFSFNKDLPVEYVLEASLRLPDADIGIFTFMIIRSDTRYIVVAKYLSED